MLCTVVKHKNIEQLRASHSPCSSDEWESILTTVLHNQESGDDVEAVAKLHNAQSVDIIVRRRVEGINVSDRDARNHESVLERR